MGRLAIAGLCVVALAACSGGDDDDDDVSSATTDTTVATTTTAPPAPTTTTLAPPPLYSFDGSVPAPPLNITGDDFDAIFRSLNAYLSWLYAHNPDIELVSEIASPGSAQHDTIVQDLGSVAQRELRIYDDALVESVEVADTAEGIVTLRVRYSGGRRVLVDNAGNIVDDTPFAPLDQIVLLSTSPTGQWRVSSISNSGDTSVGVGQ